MRLIEICLNFIIDNLISLCSLLISFVALLYKRIRIIVDFNNYIPFYANNIKSSSDQSIDEDMICFTILVINPTQFDIGYFDFRVIDNNGKYMKYLWEGFFDNPSCENYSYFISHNQGTSDVELIGLRNKRFFPAHSSTVLTIPISLNEIKKNSSTSLTIEFNIAKQKFLNYLKCLIFPKAKHKYKLYKHTYKSII